MSLKFGLLLLPVLIRGGGCTKNDPSALLDQITKALGGIESLGDIKGLSLQSS